MKKMQSFAMPYSFTYDLSKASHLFFAELATISYQKKMHQKLIKRLMEIIVKFKIEEGTGLKLSDALTLIEDFIDLQAINAIELDKFSRTEKRALLLPHCARKNMDSRFCKATFDETIPAYKCAHCSADCLVNAADAAAKKKGYDVYILPGGSCIQKILKDGRYDGVVGVACGVEIKALKSYLESIGVSYQTVPLIKNGCAMTAFNMDTLTKVLC
jgi:uncharacterized protein